MQKIIPTPDISNKTEQDEKEKKHDKSKWAKTKPKKKRLVTKRKIHIRLKQINQKL
ncbi:hypothetical protein OGZ02_13495 [Brachyspira hyodysenteriae]|nr:hypothetical protein [Brachyspira hyodysenteriae]MDA1469818.1 hypothetical protein [Brachyspira hyodysenteriae]